jgi:hypothetical protein
MLFERDRRSGEIEIRNAQKEGDCTLHFSFRSGAFFSARGGAAAAGAAVDEVVVDGTGSDELPGS